jgi:hypothetical protein
MAGLVVLAAMAAGCERAATPEKSSAPAAAVPADLCGLLSAETLSRFVPDAEAPFAHSDKADDQSKSTCSVKSPAAAPKRGSLTLTLVRRGDSAGMTGRESARESFERTKERRAKDGLTPAETDAGLGDAAAAFYTPADPKSNLSTMHLEVVDGADVLNVDYLRYPAEQDHGLAAATQIAREVLGKL